VTAREPSAAPSLRTELAIVLVVVLLAWPATQLLRWYMDWAAADIVRELSAIERAAVVAGCRIPAENEQVHIVVSRRGERLVAQCMHVGSRGTYNRTPKAAP